jgi:hypothetical protein
MPEKSRRPHHHERVQAVERIMRAWRDERDVLATVRRVVARVRVGLLSVPLPGFVEVSAAHMGNY